MDDYITVHNEIAKGGDWLRAARSWMQGNVPHERQTHMMPPAIVVFECHARIAP